MSLSYNPSLRVYVDWNNDGDYSDTGEDISAYVRSFNVKRGRSTSTDEFKAAVGSFSVRNTDGRFNPLYTASPLYPNVVPGRRVKVEATYGLTTYPQFAGRWTASDGSFNSPDGELSFEIIDAFEQFRLTTTSVPLEESKRTDECIAAILDSFGWDAGDRDLDAGLETLEKFSLAYKVKALDALQTAARQELGGGLWMGKDGKVAFRNRDHRSNQAAYATLAGTFDDLSVSLRQEDTAAIVEATYVRFETGAAGTVVFQLTGAGRTIYPGSDNAANTFEGEFSSYAASAVIEPVAVADYTANDAVDGSGSDKTAQLTIASFVATAKGFKVTFNNLDSAAVYLQSFQVRATPVTTTTEENTVLVENASPIVEGVTIQANYEHNTNAASVAGWVNWEASTRGIQQPRVIVTIRPDTDALMALVLGADIWKRVTITDTAATWNSHVTGSYFIESINLTFAQGGPAPVTAVWSLFPADLSHGTGFRISGAVGVGADYSIIAAATGDGYARISY